MESGVELNYNLRVKLPETCNFELSRKNVAKRVTT